VFSYYSEMPIIVRRLLEKAEEEEEVSEAIDDETEEEQEGTENLDVIFVENHGQIAGHEDDIAQEETADEIQDTKSDTPGGNSAWWKALVMGAAAPAIQYEVAFSLFPVLAVVTDEPLFSFYALFRKTTTVGPMRCINQVQSAVKLALAVSTSRTSNRPARDGDRAKKDSSACRVAPSALSLGLSGNGLAFNLVGSMCRARSTPHLREDAVGMPGRDRAACTACASRVETLRQF